MCLRKTLIFLFQTLFCCAHNVSPDRVPVHTNLHADPAKLFIPVCPEIPAETEPHRPQRPAEALEGAQGHANTYQQDRRAMREEQRRSDGSPAPRQRFAMCSSWAQKQSSEINTEIKPNLFLLKHTFHSTVPPL